MKQTKSFEEIENYVLDFIEHGSNEDIVLVYETLTDSKVVVADWQE
jgi:hypothetical protein